jgi:SAM-dependent methyltransferase
VPLVNDGERYFAADADLDEERARLRLIQEASDPRTVRCLDRVGVGAGWQCLEVGAGAGSVAAWLARRVGPTGHVVAIDLDVRHLGWLDASSVTVRAQDVVTGDLERGQFDVVHFRALLEHVHDVERAMNQMVGALVSGGWLVGEGGDFGRYRAVDADHPRAAGFDDVMARTFSFIRQAGIFDPFAVSSLPALLERAGLIDVGVDDTSSPVRGGDPMAVMFETSWQRFDGTLTTRGVITEAEAAGRSAAHHDPSFFFHSGAVSAWGRRP